MATDRSRDARIGPTAHYTAYTWSRLGLPHADLLATPLGAGLFWGLRSIGEWAVVPLRRLPSLEQYLELRHRTIDHALVELGPDRIVELGAGLSRRGVSWAADRGIHYHEVDLPHMIAAKRARLQQAPAALQSRFAEKLHLYAKDVMDPGLGAWLGEVLRGAHRPVVVSEGLIGYFDIPEKLRIATSVFEGLQQAGGGSFVCDLRTRGETAGIRIAAGVLYGLIRFITAGRGAGANFEDDAAIHGFFQQAGFDGAHIIDAAAAVPHLAEVQPVSAIWSAQVGSMPTEEIRHVQESDSQIHSQRTSALRLAGAGFRLPAR